jgi:hypothetical protein
MGVQYNSNFDSDTVGQLSAGWLAVIGAWAVSTTNPVSGANALRSTTNANQDIALYTGASATDQQIDWSVKAVKVGSYYLISSPILRANAAYTQGYLCQISYVTGTNITLRLFKRVGAAYTQIGTDTVLGFTLADNNIVMGRAKIVGNTISLYLGVGALPGTPTVTWTDSTYTGAGHAGFYYFLNSTAGPTSVDDVTISDLAVSGTDGTATGANLTGTGSMAAGAASGGGSASASGATLTGTGSLSPGAASAGGQVVPVDSAALLWSPFNWDTLNVGDFGVATKSKQATACGAYLRFRVTGTTSVVLNIDTSTLAGFGSTPLLNWTVGNTAIQSAQLTIGASTLTLATGLTAGTTYDVHVWFMGRTETQGTTWGSAGVSPTNVVRINGIAVDGSATVSAPSVIRPFNDAFYGDSIPEGVRAAGTTTQPADHGRSVAQFVGIGMNAEYGQLGYGATGWEQTSSYGMPPLPTTWNYHSAGRARSFAAPPRAIFVMHGYNGATTAADVSNWLTAVRAAVGTATWLFVCAAPSGVATSTQATGVANYKSAFPTDARVAFIDYSARVTTAGLNQSGTPSAKAVDGVHPYERTHAEIAAAIVQMAQAIMDGQPSGLVARTVTLSLVSNAGAAAANLSGLKWVFWDQANPALMTAPTSAGTVETTDGSGQLVIPVQSSLASGAVGWLVITDSDGTTTQNPAHKAFAGPVQVI